MPHASPARRAVLAAVATLVCPLPAQSPCRDFTRVDALTRQLVRWVAPDGAIVDLHRDGQPLHVARAGAFRATDVVPIASASKLLSAALVMTLWDDGLVDLDTPCSRWLPTFDDRHGVLTLRQLLSHTAGTEIRVAEAEDPAIDLRDAVAILGRVPLRTMPGTDFAYGEVSMQIAGRIAEVAGGACWHELFRTRIADPLGLDHTDYQPGGPTANPQIGAGARSTVADYARFLEMLAGGGVFRGERVLSSAAVEELFRDQTGGVPIALSPRRGGQRYGLGCWIERSIAGRGVKIDSPGVFGFWPWIDRERGVHGVIGTFARYDLVVPYAEAMQAWIEDRVPFAGVDCYGIGDRHCFGTPRATTSGPPRDGAIELVCEADLPGASGLLLIGAAAATPPLRDGDTTLLVSPQPDPLTIAVTTDALGRALVRFAIPDDVRGRRVFAQFLISADGACPGPAAVAGSQGLEIALR